ncbi:type II toxin-antitoxin system RelE/ParE family toxin, partial [Streptococcus pneumoniae]|nr:type II toxin-antitoxin system RelE/ParE family toxin [Streptococcus pneumoniae]
MYRLDIDKKALKQLKKLDTPTRKQ